MRTEIGKINSGVEAAKRDAMNSKTPLGEQLDVFGNQLTVIIYQDSSFKTRSLVGLAGAEIEFVDSSTNEGEYGIAAVH
jgi:hypothetical protein